MTAQLPLRYEIENLAAATGTDQIDITCMTVISEGGNINQGHTRVLDTGVTPLAITNANLVVAGIRLKAANLNAAIRPLGFDLQGTSGSTVAYWRLIFNPTLTGTETWADITDISQGLTSVPVYTEGTGYVLDSGYFDLGSGGGSNKAFGSEDSTVDNDIFLGADIAGAQDIVILVVKTVTSTGDILFRGQFMEFT